LTTARLWRPIAKLAERIGIGRLICIVLLLDVALLRLWDPAPLEALRLRTFDLFQLIEPRRFVEAPVVIVDIDEESLAEIGQWPWPRTLVAKIVFELTRMGAAAIAFDIIFGEPDRLSPDMIAASFDDLDEAAREKLRDLPSYDQVLADAMRQSRVIVGQAGSRLPTPKLATLPRSGIATIGRDAAPYLITFPGLLPNIDVLEKAAAGRGLLTIRPERDGVVRRVPTVMSAQGRTLPSLTLEMLRVATGSSAILIKTDPAGIRSVAIPGLEVPTDRNGQMWVHFTHHRQDRFVSAKDVIRRKVAPEKVAAKLVLIGTSAVGLLDLKSTPLDASMPGVEVHAQVLENVLTKTRLSAPNYMVAAELTTAILLSSAIIAFAPVLGAVGLFIIGVIIAISVAAASWCFYSYSGLLVDPTFPILASLTIYWTLLTTNYFQAHRDRRQIRSAFGQYLSPVLVEELTRAPDRLVLGGEERVMTIMFSDIRGFTSISEHYKEDPQGLTTLMNRFLTPLTNCIINHNGTIDKYIGDAIMAFWNAPIDDPNQERNACDAALEMLDRLTDLNTARQYEAKAGAYPFLPLRAGIGINTGRCLVGNLGSDLHFNYSVLGDAVNIASRLESQTKTYQVPIIAGSNTVATITSEFKILELDFITVKGKLEPEQIFAVLGRSSTDDYQRFVQLRQLHDAMLAHYRSRDWPAANEMLERSRPLASEFGLTGLYDLYEARVRHFRDNPPPPDWRGVFVAETK
jgi:adenylate cyclase